MKLDLQSINKLLLVIILSVQSNAFSYAQSPAKLLGGGNISYRNINESQQRLQILADLGCGYCRIPVHPDEYRPNDTGDTAASKLDRVIILAHENGIKPILLFEYYTKWHGPIGDYEDWYKTGKAFAKRFAPNSDWLKEQGIENWGVEHYTAINEPMWDDNNPQPIDPDDYAKALEGLADGVHSVHPNLKVSPGGYQEIPLLKKNRYGPRIAHLYNEGKLYAIDIHRYYDIDYQPMADTYKNSLQNQFDEVKKAWGIQTNIAFTTTEFNFKKREISEDEAAKGFLTAIWDALGIVGKQGKPVTEFALPWNIFHNEKDDKRYGLCTQKFHWKPNARGKVLKMVCELTQGMKFVSMDPKNTGEFILSGDHKNLIVWQNRTGWTNHLDNSYTIETLPTWANSVKIYGWDGLRKNITLTDQPSIQISNIHTEETYMFLITQ